MWLDLDIEAGMQPYNKLAFDFSGADCGGDLRELEEEESWRGGPIRV